MARAAPAMTLAPTTLTRLLIALALVVVPHARHVPLWVIGFAIGMGIWRAGVARRGWGMPGTVLRAALAIAAFGSVLATFGSINGQTPGAALLILMTALKLTETRQLRDYMILAFLGYFLLGTHFLFDQSIPMIGYLLICAVAITAVLTDINHPGPALPARTAWRTGGMLVIQALPIMAVLFVLFPRIPGPLWGLPSDAGANAVTGLSDTMTPGDITQLSLSDEVAFRVRFDGEPPSRENRYWRGPVFWFFDGRTWKEGFRPSRMQAGSLSQVGRTVAYEVTLEPHRKPWLLALDVPTQPVAESIITADRQMIARRPVSERRLYRTESALDYNLDATLGDWPRRLATSLPDTGNARARELAQQWRAEASRDVDVVNAALRHFREQPFVYTLRPPSLGTDSVDDFLFNTQRGFCEHYAHAFTFLMRAAGLPTRIVTGYQGGELNAAGDYMIVRQSDAHAWSEVWLPGEGWRRIDPTGAVSPDRIQAGLGASLPAGEPVPAMARRTGAWVETLRLRWDAINAEWNYWVLAYGPELQRSVLSRIGLPDWRSMILALTVLITMFMTALGLVMLWQARNAQPLDEAQRWWNRASRRLARKGLPRRPHEGPRDYAARVIAQRPDLTEPMQTLTDAYVATRYGGRARDDALRAAARQLKP